MERKITVKGIGHITAKPDFVVINMIVDETNKKYEKAVEIVSERIDILSNALVSVGFEADALKTSDFNVFIETGYKKSLKGTNEFVRTGYTCSYEMKLEFDFDSDKLAKAIDAIAKCVSNPRMDIKFTVKDKDAIKDELLKSAAVNAKRRAEILCEAAGGKLGELVTVDYNWNEISLLSPTRLNYDRFVDANMSVPEVPMAAPKSIKPDDIDMSDNAVFVWEIV